LTINHYLARLLLICRSNVKNGAAEEVAMSSNAKAGGILTIVSGALGVFGLVGALFLIFIFRFLYNETYTPYAPYGSGPPAEFFTFITIFYAAWGLIFALIGALAVVGGISALKKKRWGLALAGSIAGTITFFPCGIPAIIFVKLAKPEFSEPEAS
jgi:hypothetical protein